VSEREHVGLFYRYQYEHDEDWKRRKRWLRVKAVLSFFAPAVAGFIGAYFIAPWMLR
jgi:hypothetical protein